MLIVLSLENKLKAEPVRDDLALPLGSSHADGTSLGIVVKLLIKSIGNQHMTLGDAILLLRFLQERWIAL
jgi:hypothetical protein